MDDRRNLYLGTHLFLLILGLLSLWLSVHARKSKRYVKRHSTFLRMYLDAFAMRAMLAGSISTLLDQMARGQISAFVAKAQRALTALCVFLQFH